MIKKIKSKLSVKVFFITFFLTAACCAATYTCIAHFAPYIYTHKLADAEEMAALLSDELSHVPLEEARHFISAYADRLSREYDDEFVFHIFRTSGEELTLPGLDSFSGASLEDYENQETTDTYRFPLADNTEEYLLFLTKNTKKESQVIEALQKSLPLLSVILFTVSITAAFFYTWYITTPIKRISKLSQQMAEMNFNGSCSSGRTDEIGILSNSLNDLSEKLAAALSDLKEANQKLQADIDMERRLERQRVEFFSAASHELKTPVTILKGQLEGMLYQVGRYKDRETYLAQSLKTVDTLEKMVQDLLTVSRLDAPGYSCQKIRFHLSMLVQERLAEYEDLFIQRELTVEKFISPELYLSGDRRLLQKAIDNLLGNAAMYSGPGNHVKIRLWQEAERIRLTIENTGTQIPDEDIPRLFEAFYRVEQSRNRQTGGTGLGLYIVKTVLDLHGAEIQIANTVQGVMVSIQF